MILNTDSLYPTVILWGGHLGEGYMHELLDPHYVPGLARSFVVIDFDQLDDLPKDMLDLDVNTNDYFWLADAFAGETAFGHLITIHGKPEEHLHLFNMLADNVVKGPTGADDDTFDYWPGAVDALWVYAKDMYKATNDSHYKVRMGVVGAMNAEVMEFADTANALIEWSKP